jgi:hypothetical protein
MNKIYGNVTSICKVCKKEFKHYNVLHKGKPVIRKCCSRKCVFRWLSILRNKRKFKKCFICGKLFSEKNYRFNKRINCSKKCYGKYISLFHKGDKAPYWKGGKYLHGGYVMMWTNKGHVLEHRFITNTTDPKLIVHHIDGNKLNNKLDNLKVMTQSEHKRLHNTK